MIFITPYYWTFDSITQARVLIHEAVHEGVNPTIDVCINKGALNLPPGEKIWNPDNLAYHAIE